MWEAGLCTAWISWPRLIRLLFFILLQLIIIVVIAMGELCSIWMQVHNGKW